MRPHRGHAAHHAVEVGLCAAGRLPLAWDSDDHLSTTGLCAPCDRDPLDPGGRRETKTHNFPPALPYFKNHFRLSSPGDTLGYVRVLWGVVVGVASTSLKSLVGVGSGGPRSGVGERPSSTWWCSGAGPWWGG